jgi:3-dehydroquinate synthase
MPRLRVELGERAYPIHIGTGLLESGGAGLWDEAVPGSRVVIVTNTVVGPRYAERLQAALAPRTVTRVTLPDGEASKSLATVSQVYDALIEARCDRRTTLVALGGGVIGDIAGFVAATYLRGVGYVQVPTTLLAQVDSSVGGKTGVNHPGGKNLIGAFYQPRAVIADTATLTTLPDRELRAGYAEVVKYGLLGDAAFFAWLEAEGERVMARAPEALAFVIERACRDKAAVVADDEREAGRRALLNLGHTFAHAIETATGYGTWLHGEAVAVGLVLAAELSAWLGWVDGAVVSRTRAVLARAGLPTEPPATMDPEAFLGPMAVDKKVEEGVLRLVLMQGIGAAVVTDAVDRAQLRRFLAGRLGGSPRPAGPVLEDRDDGETQ